ncbi:MAG TPA: ATP-binding protein [Candidatus Saccharimonadales bacterium]|nr:ATP-binding protein [Candidatus Saccharimonadales bacterium]
MTGKLDQTKESLLKRVRTLLIFNHAEKAKSNALFESMGEGVIATDNMGRVVRTNQAATDILGYPKKELIGQWFQDVILFCLEDGSVVDPSNSPIYKTLLSGKTHKANGFFKTNEGILVPVSVTSSPIILSGRPIGALEIFRDVTKELESDRMKTEFMSLASHQLRTPLSAINTYAFLLKEDYAGKLNANQSSFVEVILAASKRMNQLISSLLNLTRLEGGKLTIASQPTDVAKQLKKSIREFEPQLKKKKITLGSDISSKLGSIRTDRMIVGEIINNLLSNAYKYSPQGGKISVSLGREGNNIVMSVKDSGYGIPSELQELVFTKFFRASNVVDREETGTGLGLYLTKILAEHIDGEIWFTSKENRGSTFYFSLPKTGTLAKQGRFKLEIT